MLNHICEGDNVGPYAGDLRRQRREIIEAEMLDRIGRRTPFQAIIQVDQVIFLGVGQCGQGEDKRIVESSFDVKVGDQLIVYRKVPVGGL